MNDHVILTLAYCVLQIYPDPQAEKAIMCSVVYCIHHKEGCAWAGELRKLKVRKVSCLSLVARTRHVVPAPRGMTIVFPKINHLQALKIATLNNMMRVVGGLLEIYR